jgi:hypothetical protein
MAERDAGLLMVQGLTKGTKRQITVGADQAYDTRDFVQTLRELGATPHVTQNDTNQLATGTINGRLAAVRCLAHEAADAGLLGPELAAGIRRVKAVKSSM